MLHVAVPVLPSRDIGESLAFYGRLNFSTAFTWGEPFEYAGITRDGIELHLFLCNEPHIAEWTSCRVKVDAIDELYAECLALNVVHPNGPLQMKPWGMREFAILDPSGVLITFAETM